MVFFLFVWGFCFSVLKRKIKIQLLRSLYTSLFLKIPKAEPWARSRLRRRPQAPPPWQGCIDHDMHPAEPKRFKALVCIMGLCPFNPYFPSTLCIHHRMGGWNMDPGKFLLTKRQFHQQELKYNSPSHCSKGGCCQNPRIWCPKQTLALVSAVFWVVWHLCPTRDGYTGSLPSSLSF